MSATLRNLNILVLILLCGVMAAQTPKLINYQGVARGNDGKPITDQAMGLQFEILQGSATGSVVYTEQQSITTTSVGMILTQIGLNSNLTTINWSNGNYFLRVSVDPTGGSNYISLGTQQILSVPYSMHAQTVPAAYNPGTNKLDVGGNSFTLSSTPATSITPLGVVGLTTTGTNSFIISVPQTSISVTSTAGAATSSVTGTNAININIPAGVTPTINGAGVAQITPSTTGNNFTITVPQTSVTVTNTPGVGGVSTAGTNTFNVNVPTPSITPSGVLTRTASGSSFTISAPATSLTSSGAAITTTNTTNSYNVFVAPTNVTGTGAALLSGSNNTFNVFVPPTNVVMTNTPGAMTFNSPGTNSFNINVPQTNVVVTSTPGVVAFNSPGTNSFNINVPAAIPSSVVVTNTPGAVGYNPTGSNSVTINVPTPTVTASGLASTTSSGFSVNVNVPVLQYTAATGALGSGTNVVNITQPLTISGTTLTSGVSTNSVSLAPYTPWRQTPGTVTLATTTDKVGLGTNAPTEQLQVQSTTDASVSVVAGNNNFSQLMMGSAGNHGLARIRYDNVLNSMSFWSNNVADRIFVEQTGNVAIGGNVPVAKLDVVGNMRVSSGGGVSKLMLGAVGGVNQGYTGIYESSSNLVFSVFKSGAPATNFGTSNTMDAMFIENTTGRIGIGTNSPTDNLQLQATGFNVMSILSGNTSASHLSFGQSGGNHSMGNIKYDNSNNSMNFWTNNTVDRLVILGNGNVGMGTSAPLGHLEVTGQGSMNNAQGQSAFYHHSGIGAALMAESNGNGTSTGTTVTYAKAILAGYNSSLTPLNATFNADVGVYGYGGTWGMMAATGNTVNPTTYVGLASPNLAGVFMGGNVGIATTAPTTTFHVVGGSRFEDGTQGTDKVMTSDASGNSSWQNSSRNTGFSVYALNPVTLSNFSFIQQTFGGVDYNDGGNFSGNAYTAPSTGVYQFNLTVSWNTGMSNTGYTFIAIYKNGSAYKYRMNGAHNQYHSSDMSVTMKLNQGDVITVFVGNFSGNTASTYTAGNLYTHFSGFRVY